MRQKIIGQDFSGRTFKGRTFTEYYRDCNFSNCKFINCTFDCVVKDCNFNGANFEKSRVDRLYSPGSTFKNTAFRKEPGLIHFLLTKFVVHHNPQIIAEIFREHSRNFPVKKKTIFLNAANTLESRSDLSWNDFLYVLPKIVWDEIDIYFAPYPIILEKAREVRRKRWR